MRYLLAASLAILLVTAAIAQQPSCKAQVAQKKLTGAAEKSFLTKCERDANAACNKSAADKKLAGAAKDSFLKKCVSDGIGLEGGRP
jgi:hypothetical protein